MKEQFDFVVVGGGSAGAVIAARLSEDPTCRVALLEAGAAPPPLSLMPVALSLMHGNPETDWCFTADAGGIGRGLEAGRMMVTRGKMLGGSSSLNYMAYVRGHPGDFDAWAAGGATGWSHAEVLPYFRKSEGLVPSDDIVVDEEGHGREGPLGVSVRKPILPAARGFVEAVKSLGVEEGDYNGRHRLAPGGVVSLFQTTTRAGKRSSTYHAFLAGETEARPNLTIMTGVHVTRVVLEDTADGPRAVGVEVRTAGGETLAVSAAKEVILSAGAVGSPQLLLLSGIGPEDELARHGITTRVDSPHVGKHLKDHLHMFLAFPATGIGVSMLEVGMALGPDALRSPAGPLPVDPAEDEHLSPELLELKAEAERRLHAWTTTGESLASSSLYEAVYFYSTGLGDAHTHDAQIGFLPCGLNEDVWRRCLRTDPALLFADPSTALGPHAETVLFSANPVQPHSEGELVLASADPTAAPDIRMNYLSDPHDLEVMLNVIRKVLEIVEHWPKPGKLGPLVVPPFLAEKHGHSPGDVPSDALLEDFARHFALTVYHLTSTCRIGDVVDAELRVRGVRGLRVADASVMPNVVSGNTNAACIMIGEKAAALVARAHGLTLKEGA